MKRNTLTRAISNGTGSIVSNTELRAPMGRGRDALSRLAAGPRVKPRVAAEGWATMDHPASPYALPSPS